MTAIVVQGDARRLPLPDASVDLVVTSPPFFALRSYQDDGEHYAGQLGSETTPAEFVDALIECTREMMRVLKPSGSMFVNLGDKYASAAPGAIGPAGSKTAYARSGYRNATWNVRTKSIIGIPWRYAIQCIDDLGLILRAEIIWDKPNGLPESVTDRVRRSHEVWFHLVKQPRYFSATDEVRESQKYPNDTGRQFQQAVNGKQDVQRGELHASGISGHYGAGARTRQLNPLGKLPGSVWSIPSQPLAAPAHLGIEHFAAFPCEWPRRLILGWSPSGICVECGQGRRPVSVGENTATQRTHNGYTRGDPVGQRGGMTPLPMRRTITITGYACSCPAPTATTRPSVILDPFGGTGTTALVASALGRIGITVDLSFDYSRLAKWRVASRSEIARALHVQKPPESTRGQMEMFGV